MNVFRRLFKSILRSGEMEEEGGVTMSPGELFTVEITMSNVLEYGGSWIPLCNKVAAAMGLGHADILFNDNGVYFEVYDIVTGEIYIVDVADVDHMNDYLLDVQENRVGLGPMSIQLRYINKK